MAVQNAPIAPKIGEVYYMQFKGTGSEQTGWRPGLILQNNIGNAHSPNVIALPLTSNLKKSWMPTHVIVRAEDSGLPIDSMVLCENPGCLSKERIGKFITKLPDQYMQEVAKAHLLATSVVAYLDLDTLFATREEAVSMNAAVC